MSLLTRYLFQNFFKVFLLVLCIFLSLYTVMDFFEKLSAFLGSKRPLIYFLEYLFWKSQVNLYQIFPYILSLTLILTLLFLSRTHELLALLSLGIARGEIFKRFLFLLFLCSLVGGVILNFLVPKAYYNTLYTWETKIQSQKAHHLIFKDTLFFEGEGFLLIARPLEPKGEYLSEVALLFFNEAEEPERLIWAKTALYLGEGVWRLEEALFQEARTHFRPKILKNWEGSLPLKPRIFVTIEKPVKFASFKELKQRLNFLQKVGRRATEVWVEIFNRLLYLLLPLFIGGLSAKLYLKGYTPHHYTFALLKSLLAFFILSALFVSFQTLLTRLLH